MQNTKYLIVGTGGVGGSIAAMLSLNGNDVTCIARGAHLETMRRNGLRFISGLKGCQTISIKSCTAEEYNDKADVIFVSVKAYSLDSVIDLLRKSSNGKTVIIPLLNIFGTGQRIKQLLPEHDNVLAGCIYIVAYVSAPGEITQMGKTFRVVFGEMKGTAVDVEMLQTVRDDLISSGVKVTVSEDIDCDTFIKYAFISAMACTGAYFDVPMREVQKEGEIRKVFTGLSSESCRIGKAMGMDIPDNLTEENLKIIDGLDPGSTASMQKDLANGHVSEIDGLLFEFIRLAEKYNIDVPTYRKIVKKFT
ncbi:MAG: ketopantoate reductase family protein [Tannerella sp.]|jgi:2-dehydropantoate 2-reductase|nr:ketopantoate reductase family protein [Tannerella sp.]